MKEIDKYMTVNEAAERFDIPVDTIKSRLKPSIKSFNKQVEQMLEDGLIKYHIRDGGQRKEWIISEAAMKIWFPNKIERGMSIMNMERKYIKHAIEDMEKRLEYLLEMKQYHEKKIKSAEEEELSYKAGFHNGYIAATELEMDFLGSQIKFLRGALEEN